MENVMVFDDKTKKRLGIMCFIPATCFFIFFVYFFALILPHVIGNHPIYEVEAIINAHYTTLFIMVATAAIITAPIFIYCLVILARVKNMNAPTKMRWILCLSVMAPIASMFFWVFVVRKEPKEVGIYPSIA